MAGRRASGEGTIYRRKDGRYEGAAYFLTTSGQLKRIRVYGKTRQQAREKLTAAMIQGQRGIPVADKTWKLGEYLGYWLEEIIKPNRRPTTYDLYESNIRLYLKPGLGHLSLTRLSVQTVQTFFNRQRAEGHSVNKVHKLREVLGSALGHAQHEEHVARNVAWLAKLPSEQRAKIRPWALDEITRFLDVAKTHQWYSAFVLALLYGLRRGEVLGLRWCDVKLAENELYVRQQVFRANGMLQQGPVKTAAGQRELPLLAFAREPLLAQQARQVAARSAVRGAWRGSKGSDELVFTTPDGGMVEPQNFTRSFQRLCMRYGLRRIKLHHLRHTTNTMLKMLGVQPRDRQLILGHSNVHTTQQIYEHDDMQWRRQALSRFERVLTQERGDSHQAKEPGDYDVARTTFSRQDSLRSRQNSRQDAISAGLAGRFAVTAEAKNIPATEVTAAGMLELLLGDLTGNRTRISRMKSPTSRDWEDTLTRVTEVRAAMQARARQWILGIVAVNLAVKILEDTDIKPDGQSPK